MSRSVRLATAAAAALAALAFTGPAWAAFSPRLIAVPITNAPGRPTAVILGHAQEIADDAPAKDTLYAPLGYQANLTQPVGTKIGEAETTLVLRDAGNAQIDAKANVVVDNPAAHPNDPCVLGQGLHQAVWRINITIAGVPLSLYVYVDAITAGPEATFASAKIQFCFLPPGTLPGRPQVLIALFDVNGVFTNPANTQPRLWRGLFTPYSANGNPNPAGTVEGQALVPGRVSLKLSVKSLRHGRIILSGRLLADGQPVARATVDIYVGERRVGRVRTNSSGRFTLRKRIKKKTRYQAFVTYVADLASCVAPPLPGVPQGCKSATEDFAVLSNRVTARRRR